MGAKQNNEVVCVSVCVPGVVGGGGEIINTYSNKRKVLLIFNFIIFLYFIYMHVHLYMHLMYMIKINKYLNKLFKIHFKDILYEIYCR